MSNWMDRQKLYTSLNQRFIQKSAPRLGTESGTLPDDSKDNNFRKKTRPFTTSLLRCYATLFCPKSKAITHFQCNNTNLLRYVTLCYANTGKKFKGGTCL